MTIAQQVIYLHGFNSSPQSLKAVQTQAYLAQHHPKVGFSALQLANIPEQVIAQLTDEVNKALTLNRTPYFIGSSLGGFLATYLAEQYGAKAALINPAVKPARIMQSFLGEHENSYTKQRFEINQDHITQLKALEVVELKDKTRYFVLVQTGDEVLDHTLAIDYYQGCQLEVQQGGDHSFQNYEQMLPAITAFFQLDNN